MELIDKEAKTSASFKNCNKLTLYDPLDANFNEQTTHNDRVGKFVVLHEGPVTLAASGYSCWGRMRQPLLAQLGHITLCTQEKGWTFRWNPNPVSQDQSTTRTRARPHHEVILWF